VTNYLVTHSLITRITRATLSLLVIAAWFSAANHCVVAGMVAKAAATVSAEPSCPGHPSPEQQEEKSGDCDASSCCKALASPVTLAKVAAQNHGFTFAKDFPAIIPFAVCDQHVAAIEEIDTGPPRPPSFAESILQRSLLAHAPPFVV
jgi:hypothetical protein